MATCTPKAKWSVGRGRAGARLPQAAQSGSSPAQDRPPHMQINRLFLIIILVGLVGVTGTIAWKLPGG